MDYGIGIRNMNLDILLAEREIERQLISFARAMDNRDWTKIDAICVDDICADFGTGEVVGSKALIEFMRSFLDHCGPSQHLLGNIVIDVDGDRATSESYVSDMHLGKNSDEEKSFRTLGNYTDSWIKIDGVWKLLRRMKDNRAFVGTMDVFNP